MIRLLTGKNAFEFRPATLLNRAINHVRFRNCYTNNTLVPPLEVMQAQLNSQLRRNGSVVLDRHIPSDRLKILQDELNRALNELKFETPCLAQAKIDPVRHEDLIKNFMYGTVEQLKAIGVTFDRSEMSSLEQAVHDFKPSTLTLYMLATSEAFRETWLDPYLLTIIAHYMGMVPKMTEAYVRRNFPSPYRTMNHFWHRDLNNKQHLLKVFFFLSDCTLDTGPHEFILGSHTDYRLNGQRYFKDEQTDTVYPPGSPQRLVSEVKAGTVIIEDTRGLHRAQMPNHGYRDLGYAVFVPMGEHANVKCYEFPRESFDKLMPLQQAFISSCNLF